MSVAPPDILGRHGENWDGLTAEYFDINTWSPLTTVSGQRVIYSFLASERRAATARPGSRA